VAFGRLGTLCVARSHGGPARVVAVKRIYPNVAKNAEFVSVLRENLRVVARIQHPNVVSTLEVVEAEGEVLVVTEYVQGESLSYLMKRATQASREAPRPVYVAIVASVLAGLDAAHDARDESGQPLQIVHRGLSPNQVLIGLDGVPRILDFGMAKASLLVAEQLSMGKKVGYMPPEQTSKGVVDRRADLYAVGAMLWEGLTGQRLFDTTTGLQVMIGRLLRNEIDPPSKLVPDVPKALDAVVLKALASDREQRYATAREMQAALEDAVPPATTREVGDWVSLLAGEELRARAAELRQIVA
jgi:eukaryotic-like serine/threonine-protein kinase